MAVNGLYDALERLRACMCFALEETIGGSPCFCCVIHRPDVSVFDQACKCGAAWVRLVEMVPMPEQRAKRLASGLACVAGDGLRTTVELGVLRCVPESGKAPNGTDLCSCLESHAEGALDDLTALVRAVECCDLGAQIVRVRPAGRDDCAGTTVHATIDIGMCVDCDSPPDSPSDSPGESPAV